MFRQVNHSNLELIEKVPEGKVSFKLSLRVFSIYACIV